MTDPLNDGPSMAISIRFEHRAQVPMASRYRHDLRKGPQPWYILMHRSSENSEIVPYTTIRDLKQLCVERREQRQMRRAMKSTAAIGSSFLISFGKGLQPHVEALSVDQQDALYKAVADAVADRLGNQVVGLVAHRDESAPHAHGVLPAVGPDGRPMSKVITRRVASEIQQIAEDATRPFLPMIGPRKKKGDRIYDGDDPVTIYHRSVRQLHDDLPRELAAIRQRAAEAQSDLNQLNEKTMQVRIDAEAAAARLAQLRTDVEAAEQAEAAAVERRGKNEALVEKARRDLEKYAEDEEKLAKVRSRLTTYEGRVATAEQAEADARKRRDDAQAEITQLLERASRLRAGMGALVKEATEGTIRINPATELIILKDPAPVLDLPELVSLGRAAATAAEKMKKAEVDARQLVAQASQDATAILASAAEVAQEADRKMLILRNREGAVRGVLTRFKALLDRVGQRLGLPAAQTLLQSVEQLELELDPSPEVDPFSPAKESVDPASRPGL